jgi:glycosyltransferase involved in cell wall biosynthesis
MTNLNNFELKQLYSEAAIFWHACGLNEKNPQLIEHFGMTTVEAMQNYCVPIVIDGGGQREIVEQGISGFRFKTKEELQSYTIKLINDDNLRKKMARNAYDRSQDFTKEEFKKKALEFFSDIENRLRGGEAMEMKEATTHE